MLVNTLISSLLSFLSFAVSFSHLFGKKGYLRIIPTAISGILLFSSSYELLWNRGFPVYAAVLNSLWLISVLIFESKNSEVPQSVIRNEGKFIEKSEKRLEKEITPGPSLSSLRVYGTDIPDDN